MATTDEQYEIVYQGIAAVAARCDGAVEQDGVGFNGQDTKFGRRIAAMSFDQWTEDIRAEAARIANTYQVQIQSYTGVDVSELDVVKEALGKDTNRVARDQARASEYRSKSAADRQVVVLDGKLAVKWGKDPEFSELLAAVQRCPGRRYLGYAKANEVDASDELEMFIDQFDFNVSDEARKLLDAPREAPAPVYEITLEDNGQKVFIKTELTAPGQPAADAVRALQGRSFDRARYGNTADVHPEVIAFARQYGISIHPDAEHACIKAQEALNSAAADALVEEDRRVVMAHVSRQKDPGALPPVFVDMLAHVLPADIAERVIA